MSSPENNDLDFKSKDGVDNVHVTVIKDTNPHKQQQTMIYGVNDVPPVFMWPIYGMQQAIICVASTLLVPFLIPTYVCAEDMPEVRAKILSITFVMCGVATLLQTIIGVRLPIVQGSSYAFLPAIVAMMNLDKWKCPAKEDIDPDDDEPWKVRIREIQGNLLLASFTQVILGGTGFVGFLLRFIGPITIAPTITLIPLGFTNAVFDFGEKHWGIAAFTVFVVLILSLWMGNLRVPVPSYSRNKGCHMTRFRIFVVISVLMGMCLGWILSYVLTVTDVLSNNSTDLEYRARTDINLDVIDSVPWVEFPYPFMFGTPTFSLAGYIGMLLATLSSMLESIGDYYACARVSIAPPPPQHAVNRGIASEGFSSIISALVGSGHGTTSYSTNISAISITRVASRRVCQMAGLLMLLMGVLTKFVAVMTLIPDPVMGGLNAVLLGAMIAVGISTLQFVDMNSPRNVTVVGLTFMVGLSISQWVNQDPSRINTGNATADQVLQVFLGTPMFLGGVTAALLDNLAPGTPEERGLIKWRQPVVKEDSPNSEWVKEQVQQELKDTYDLPFISDYLRKVACCRRVPFLPSFTSFTDCCQCCGPSEEKPQQCTAEGKEEHDKNGVVNDAFSSTADGLTHSTHF